MRHSFWRQVGFVSLAALAVGCGDGESVTVHPVSGKLTRGGKPLAGVMVTFTPTAVGNTNAPGVSSSGLTNANGEFVLVTQTGKSGAIAGKHKVQLTVPTKTDTGGGNWGDPAFIEKMTKQRQAGLNAGASGAPVAEEKSDLVPAEYADGEKTPLTYEVKPGSNSFDIPIP